MAQEYSESPPQGNGLGMRVRLFVHEHPNMAAILLAAVGVGATILLLRSRGGGVSTVPQTSNDTTSGTSTGTSGDTGMGTIGGSSGPDLSALQTSLNNLQTTLATFLGTFGTPGGGTGGNGGNGGNGGTGGKGGSVSYPSANGVGIGSALATLAAKIKAPATPVPASPTSAVGGITAANNFLAGGVSSAAQSLRANPISQIHPTKPYEASRHIVRE